MNDTIAEPVRDLVDVAVDIVVAYVSHNSLPAADLSRLIAEVHTGLLRLASPAAVPVHQPLVPAVSIRKSITPDYLICLEDGKKFKSLKRHLRTNYQLSPDEYRAKWGLASDYPMVAPTYSATRSALARSNGLGRKAAPPAIELPAAKPSRKRAAATV
jgi:predicted transcriptional regulator